MAEDIAAGVTTGNGAIAEQLLRQNVGIQSDRQEDDQGNAAVNNSDTVEFSAEAVELSTIVQPTGETENLNQTQQPPASETASTEAENIPRFLDVRA